VKRSGVESTAWFVVLVCGVLVALSCFVPGCILHGNGGYGIKHSETWTFFHETEKSDTTQKSASEVNIPGLWDWLFPKPKPPEPEATVVVTEETVVQPSPPQ